ncbi:hypothetical protein D6855_14635 [Butyrivibrio sp. CB08]|uniref:polysaccharide deacetylase family protein n=1 Tax=Butyrivibrio sp. CB08 TaxID=2364879 RepID=UPI000EAA9BEB|nr:polysaccharide deacetylase family protein [Butyrivibrio sp. CB08]RKM56897.1 hypothetical protein D6855_14635 [Butyrivibrio sp. CB08]
MGKNLKKTINLTLCMALIASTLAGCGLFDNIGKKNDASVDLNEVQSISYDATKEYEEALQKFNAGCDGAAVIRDDRSIEDKQISLVLLGTEDTVLTERAMELLEDHKYKASFALTAIEAAEDDEVIKTITTKGHEILDNGLNSTDDPENLSDEDLIYRLAASKKVFSTLMEIGPNKLFLNTTYYPDNVRKAAKACGYDKLISPTSGRFLNGTSFADKTKAEEYVGRLESGSIVVFKLKGAIDTLELSPKLESKNPALDKQPDAVITTTEDSDEKDVITVLSWLLDALDKAEYKLVKLDSFKALTDEEYVASLLENNGDLKAQEYTSVPTLENVGALAFKGVCEDPEDMKDLLKTLSDSRFNATFFLNSDDIAQHRESVDLAVDGGFSMDLRTANTQDYKGKEIYDIYESLGADIRTMHKELMIKPRYLMTEGTTPDNLSYACSISGLGIVPFTEGMKRDPGRISCIDLSKKENVARTKTFITECKKTGYSLVDVTELIKKANKIPEIDEITLKALREENDGRKAAQRNMIYTSEKAMSMIFFGVTNKVVLEDVLGILRSRGYKATFFVTPNELINCDQQINMIMEDGCEIGLAYVSKGEDKDDFNTVASNILGAQQYATWKYGIEPNLVFQPFGTPTDEVKEAISAAGCTFVGHEYALVQSKYQDATDAASFYGQVSSKIDAHRGSIAYFNMNYFTADKDLEEEGANTLLGSLLKRFINGEIRSLTYTDVYGEVAKSTIYKVKTFSALAHTSYCYAPGRTRNNEIADNKNVLANMASAQEQNSYMASRYIGNSDVTVIPGFADSDMKMFDTSGKITEDKVLFLTFDDWGNEKDINELLYVLDKYGVKANFFVRTNNVKGNPNVLRAIAVDGHLVGSHSDTHFEAWNVEKDDEGNYKYSTLSDEDAAKLRKEVVVSYNTLNRYCGDVVVDGKRALSTIYRPPTLAVSREGMYQLFDVGYSYIVNGDFSSKDYQMNSVDELVSEFRYGMKTWHGNVPVENGSCLIMHMSPTAKYTAEALDIMIPEWQSQGYSFARIDDYLR